MRSVYKFMVLTLAAAVGWAVMIGGNAGYAAASKPVEMEADTIEYNSQAGIMTAQGNIKFTQDGAVMTGSQAEYNSKTQEAHVWGGVTAVKDTATMTASEVFSKENNNHLIAVGDVILISKDNRLTGPQVDYYVDRDYALVPAGGRLTMPDGTMTADHMEAFLKENRAIGTGSVHIVSGKQQLDATGDQAVYYGGTDAKSKIVLTGHAYAIQNGNTLTGDTLTIIDGKAMTAEGSRPKLVVLPQ